MVVFRPPHHPDQDWIKRVIGLPGDRIAYHDNTVYVNGQPLAYETLGAYAGKGNGAEMTGARGTAENAAGPPAHGAGARQTCRSWIRARASGRCRPGIIS